MEKIVKAIIYGVAADGQSIIPLQLVTEGTASDAEPVMLGGALAVENYNMAFNGATYDRLRSLADSGDAQAALTLGLLATVSRMQAWNGATYDRVRVANVFKSADITVATALNPVVVWTPAAGKKFRLMGFIIQLSGNATAAAAATYVASLFDAAAALPFKLVADVPASIVGAVVGENTGQVQLGNGYLSVAINNVLNFTPTVALTNGQCTVTVWGTEE